MDKIYTGIPLKLSMSAPRSGPLSSMYSIIPHEPISLHYATVNNDIKIIKLVGQDMWVSKTDITDTFKVILIHPSQWH